ncbi:clathrin interactor EPSIN 1-like isoform X2 [Phaseolus vulgaris]|uniref:clathrin interactor EPSIN 1-like isoform X2 n=1 Tax=Phaseolus vulgaris TaxID=3885 RepID=UPI0035CB72A0
MAMNVLWTRLGETGKDWRYVYKALAVIEYLVAHGCERAVDDIIEHTFHFSAPNVASGAPSPNQNIRSSGGSKTN